MQQTELKVKVSFGNLQETIENCWCATGKHRKTRFIKRQCDETTVYHFQQQAKIILTVNKKYSAHR